MLLFKKIKKPFLITILVLSAIVGFFLSVKGTGTIYYVDANVTDTNVGSCTPDFTTYDHTTFATEGGTDSVFKTIADLNACTFAAGDTINFRRGQTWNEQLTISQSGTAGNPITFQDFGSGAKPIIDAQSTRTYCITMASSLSYITLKNIQVQNSVATIGKNITAGAVSGGYIIMDGIDSVGGTLGIDSGFKSNSTYQNITITNPAATNRGGLNLSGTASNVTISNVTVSGSAYHGFRILNITNLTASGLVAHDNTGIGINIDSCDTVNITDSASYDNASNGWDFTTADSNVTVDGCQAYSNDHDGFAFHGSGTNNVVKNSLAYDNGVTTDNTSGDGFTNHNTADLDLYYNIAYGNFESCIGLGGTGDSNVYNNTCYNNFNDAGTDESNNGIMFLDSDGIYNLKNNIIANHEYEIYVGITADGTFNINNNLYYDSRGGNAFYWKGTASNFADWVTNSGDTNSLNVDPLWVSTSTPNFHLQSNSPAINAGPDAGLTTDYEGNSIIGLPDMGAYEFLGGVIILRRNVIFRRNVIIR